ncbi:hypothetical protein GGI24_004433 [Coemansia furcata]|nr:hypothetical protein GGI24_004433 [Coemansia furcata]
MPPVPTRPLPPLPSSPDDKPMNHRYISANEIAERSPVATQRGENKLLRVFMRYGAAKKDSATSCTGVGCNDNPSNRGQSLNITDPGGGGWFGISNSNRNRNSNNISSRSTVGWDDTSSDRSTISGATLVGSTVTYNSSYGYGACPTMEHPGRDASMDLGPQSFVERWQSPHSAYGRSRSSQGSYDVGHGHYIQTRRGMPERSVSVSYTDTRIASDVGVLRFILRPHAIYTGILEVVDCDDMSVTYRKISRDGRPWCETFHEVPVQAAAAAGMACSAYAEPALVGSVDSRWTLTQSANSTMSPTSTVTTCGSPDHRHQRQKSWWQAAESQYTQRCPQTFELNQLWEMSSPCPTSFPLHCRDARGVIDPIPMTAMVSDRHQFCYRFHLAGNRMKWIARSASAHMVELQCFVRTTLVAVLQFGDNLAPDRRRRLRRRQSGKGIHALTADAIERLPVVTIFPLAFSKLAPVDADIVESFVLFTGIEVLECIFYRAA